MSWAVMQSPVTSTLVGVGLLAVTAGFLEAVSRVALVVLAFQAARAVLADIGSSAKSAAIRRHRLAVLQAILTALIAQPARQGFQPQDGRRIARRSLRP